MAVQDIYKLDKIVFPGPIELHTLGNVQTKFGIKSQMGRAAGQVYANFVATERQQPQVDFTTKQLDTLLGLIGVGGACFSSPLTYYLKRATCAGNASRASTVHKKSVVNSACAYWTSIKLSHNGQAEVSVSVMANYDGTNDPIITTAAVALTGNLTASNYFGLGPSYINTTAIPGVQEITINNQVKLHQAGSDSDEFDTFIGIETIDTDVTIKTLQPTNWEQLLLRGLALNGVSGLTFFARKYLANGSRVANATAAHLKFVVTDGRAIPVDGSGNEAGPVSDTLKIEAIALSDSAVPLTGAVATAITAPVA